MQLRITISFLVFVCCHALSAEPQIEREFEPAALRMTYSDLDTILFELQQIVEFANSSFESNFGPDIRFSISSGGDTLSYNDWPDFESDRYLPPRAVSSRFTFSYRGAPITHVSITLTDRYRSVTVSGTDASQVQAVSATLREDFDLFETYFGGGLVQFVCFIGLFMLGFFLMAVGFPKPYSNASRVIGLIILLGVYALPLDSWFPGTAIYAENASFIDRNSNYISLFGVVFTVISTLAISLLQKSKSETKEHNQQINEG